MIDGDTLIIRNERAVYRELASGGGVLLHLDTAAYHAVNDVGALIWTLLDGSRFSHLLDRLEKELRDPPSSLASDVQEFVEALAERDLVVLQVAS